MKLKFKKQILILLILLTFAIVFSGCSFLDRFFGFLFGNSDNTTNTGGSKIYLEILFSTSVAGDYYAEILDANGNWVSGYTPKYLGYYDGTNWPDPITHTFDLYDLPSGSYNVRVFIDVNYNEAWDSNEPLGEASVYIDLQSQTEYRVDITVKDINAVKNGDFSDPGAVDNWGVYYTTSDRDSYLNDSVNGDFLPAWTYYIDDGTFSNYKEPEIIFDFNINAIELRTNNTNSTVGSSMGLTQSGINYTVNSNSKLEISFRIINFGGGDFINPWYEAPVKIMVLVNGTWYVARGYTTKATYDSTYGEGVLSTNTDYTRTIDLSGLSLITDDGTATTYTLQNGDIIQDIEIKCNGWYWDVIIYYIKITG